MPLLRRAVVSILDSSRLKLISSDKTALAREAHGRVFRGHPCSGHFEKQPRGSRQAQIPDTTEGQRAAGRTTASSSSPTSGDVCVVHRHRPACCQPGGKPRRRYRPPAVRKAARQSELFNRFTHGERAAQHLMTKTRRRRPFQGRHRTNSPRNYRIRLRYRRESAAAPPRGHQTTPRSWSGTHQNLLQPSAHLCGFRRSWCARSWPRAPAGTLGQCATHTADRAESADVDTARMSMVRASTKTRHAASGGDQSNILPGGASRHTYATRQRSRLSFESTELFSHIPTVTHLRFAFKRKWEPFSGSLCRTTRGFQCATRKLHSRAPLVQARKAGLPTMRSTFGVMFGVRRVDPRAGEVMRAGGRLP